MEVIKDYIGKQAIVRDYIKKFSIGTFIETGTYTGEMVGAFLSDVEQIYSIELSEELCRNAEEKFANSPHVHIVQGDSGKILPEIMKDIKEPCLFWLDGHYSGGITARGETDTPILQELDAILSSPYDHIILIDDARCYKGEDDYPSVETIKAIIHKVRPDWVFEVKDDIIRTHPADSFISMTTLGKFGGFGNQLFQYHALKSHARAHNLKPEVPQDWIGRKLFACCNDEILSQTPCEQKVFGSEKPIWLDKELKNCDIKGYFQYHTRFYDKDYFRSLFNFVPELDKEMVGIYQKIKGDASTVVAIHIRLGDYDTPARRHNIAPSKWYLEWLKENWDKLDNPVLFIASDEVGKIAMDFKDYKPKTFSKNNFLCDFYVLRRADVLLISNSTFSFTAAMLNTKGKFYRPDFAQEKMASFDPWDSEPILIQPLRLHLGCGGQRHKGFINIDCVKTPATDMVCDIRKLPYGTDSIDTIESYHVFEHIPVCLHANVSSDYGEKYASLIAVLKEWWRVLKKDGLLVIEMPDLDGVIKEYLNANEKRRDELLIGIYGSYRGKDNTDIHRWGANENRLRYLLDKVGFKYIKFCEAQDYHKDSVPCLRVEAIK